MQSNSEHLSRSRQQMEWPIFTQQLNEGPQSFWIKRWPTGFTIESISKQEQFQRIGRKKQLAKEYYYALTNDGYLLYSDRAIVKINHVKGHIQLNLEIFVKIAGVQKEISGQKDTQNQSIKIQKSQQCFIYIWNNDQIVTQCWLKLITSFSLGQNFDGIYNIIRTIDQGAFSTVYMVSRNQNQQEYMSAKVYHKERVMKNNKLKVLIKQECECLKVIKSKFIVKLYEVIQLDDAIILIFEYLPGQTLAKYAMNNEIQEVVACEIVYQVSQGLSEIHKANYVHRDIKPDNIMINFDPVLQIKVIDFGFAEKINRQNLVSGQGTAGYIAPELFQSKPYTELCDVFSLGIIFYYLLFKLNLFEETKSQSVLEQNQLGDIIHKVKNKHEVSCACQRVLLRMLETDYCKRIQVDELIVLLDLLINSLKIQPINKQQSVIDNVDSDIDDVDLRDFDSPVNQYNLIKLKQSSKYYNKIKWIN